MNFNYDISTLEGTSIYSTEEIGTREYKIDQENVFNGLRQGLKLMKEGETLTFLFPSYKAFGYYGDQEKIGRNVPIRSTITLNKIIEEDNLVERAAEMGVYIEAEVEKLKSKHKSIGDFRNTGLLGCIELVKNRKTKEPITPWNAAPEDMEVTNKMAEKIRELGMFTFVRWNYIFIAPPLNVSKAEVDEGLKIISQAIAIADKYCN